MARAWLPWLGVAMLVSSCLVITTPDIKPQQTPPFLLPATADPDPREVLVIDLAKIDDKPEYDFKSKLISEDAGQEVQSLLYIDYGYPDDPYKRPYRITTPISRTPPGSFNDKTRPLVEGKWFPKELGVIGCHTVTLVASHAFDPTTQCPVCPADASQITWQVYLCDSSASAPGSACDKLDFSACKSWTKSCALSAPDAGAQCNQVE